MSMVLHRADVFEDDVTHEFVWYATEAGIEVGMRFQLSVETTLDKIIQQPDLGHRRRFQHPQLRGLRSLAVDSPFNRLLIFYRFDGSRLEAWRLMHGARDLKRRLVEPSAED